MFLIHLQTMNKKILSIISAFSLFLATSLSVFAVPSAVQVTDSAYLTSDEDFSISAMLAYKLSGDGTEQSPYLISGKEDLLFLSQSINAGNCNDSFYKLTCDIDLGGCELTPIGTRNNPFCGHFDGDGHKIENYKLSSAKYSGLFGYAVNATIENVYLSSFDVNFSSDEEYALFVGGLVGYIVSTGDGNTSKISHVKVSASKFDVNSSSKYSYIGNIVGTADSKASGNVLISDSFATSDVSFTTGSGYGYVGGIAGLLKTGFGAKTLVSCCYNTGSVSSNTHHSSHAGGLAGHIFSYGSAYAPAPGELDKEGLGDDPSLSLTLAASDTDIMISNSFAVANVSANSSHYYSNAGTLVGSCNQHATVSNIFYPTDAAITVSPVPSSTLGGKTEHSNLKSQSYLSQKCEFDFDNTWTFVSDCDYPVLKCMVSRVNITLNVGDNEEVANTTVSVRTTGVKVSEVLSNVDLFDTCKTPIGISKNANGSNMLSLSDTLTVSSDDVYYIVWDNADIDSNAPVSENINSIRTDNPCGIRYKAYMTTEAYYTANEVGFVIARYDQLKSADVKLYDFTLDSDVNKVYAYNKDTNGKDKIFLEDDVNTYFTAVLYNIPDKHLDTQLVARPFATVDGTTYYGKPIKKSICEVAEAIRDNDYSGLTSEQVEYIKSILTKCRESAEKVE